MDDSVKVPACPGCHFGCAITLYQCGRGERLLGVWEAGGELPERRGPGGPGGRGGGKPGKPGTEDAPAGLPPMSENDRIMHLLHIVGIALCDLKEECGADVPERRVVDCIMRHDGAASAKIISGRIHLGGEELDTVLQALQGDGLVALRQAREGTESGKATTLYELTDTGRERADAWREENRAAEAAFLDVLSDEEKEQLHRLVFKILEPGFKRRGM